MEVISGRRYELLVGWGAEVDAKKTQPDYDGVDQLDVTPGGQHRAQQLRLDPRYNDKTETDDVRFVKITTFKVKALQTQGQHETHRLYRCQSLQRFSRS